MIPTSLARMRALLAQSVTGGDASGDADAAHLGSIELTRRQQRGVAAAARTLQRYGGVLIADDVGTGKTYIALALCRGHARVLVVAPAGLRAMWHDAARRAGVRIAFASVESLSRTRVPAEQYDCVIVDEAHHLRNPATRRYRAALKVIAGAKVVLVSATPVHNRGADLDALLSLFLGAAARDLDDEARAHIVVRTADAPTGPTVTLHRRIPIRDVPEVIAAIDALPALPGYRESGEARALVQISLLRAWCSSAAALASMARRAAMGAYALRDALRAGRHPSRAEVARWWSPDDGQLAFAPLVAPAAGGDAPTEDRVNEYVAALDGLLSLARSHSALDDARARALRAVCDAHPGVPVLACTQYAATAAALWSRARHLPGVAVLTSRGGRIASGTVSRDEVLWRFAPRAHGGNGTRATHAATGAINTNAVPLPPHERVMLLIATDLVSEGLNLHDAGVVVHLDTPWTSARLAQRVGRVARLGSPHTEVHSYRIAPPRGAGALLELERRVRHKQHLGARLAGGGQRSRALIGRGSPDAQSPAEAYARIATLLARAHRARVAATAPAVCAVQAPQRGWLALVGGHRSCDRQSVVSAPPRMVVRLGRRPPTTDPRSVVRGVEYLATGSEMWLCADWESVLAEAEAWLAHERARVLAGTTRMHEARAAFSALTESLAAAAAAGAHERALAAQAAGDRLGRFADAIGRARTAEQLLALVVFSTDDCKQHERTGGSGDKWRGAAQLGDPV